MRKSEVKRTHLLGQIRIWIGPSYRAQLEKFLKIFISWPFWSCHKFWKVGNFVITCYVEDKWATPTKFGVLGFLSKFRWSPSPLKLEGSHGVILGEFSFFMEQATCALIPHSPPPPNPSSQVVHNRHLVLRKKKTHPNRASSERYHVLHLGNTWKRLPKQVMPT